MRTEERTAGDILAEDNHPGGIPAEDIPGEDMRPWPDILLADNLSRVSRQINNRSKNFE